MRPIGWAWGLVLSVVGWHGCARSTVDLSSEADVSALGARDGGTAGDGDDGEGGDGSPPLDDGDAGGGGSGDDAGSPPVKNPRAGFYAARRVYQQTQTISGSLAGVPLNGKLLNTHTIYSIVLIGDDGSYVERACGADIKSKDADGASGLFESGIELNPAIFDHLEPVKHRITITESGWSVSSLFQPFGWNAASPSDAIPQDASDPRVIDLDQDGHPGITVKLSGNVFASGELYAVQSVRYSAEGTFEGDMLVGQNFDMGEQVVLDGTIVDTEQMVQAAGDSSTNRMHLVKRADTSLTCAQLLADPLAIFPPHPVL